MHGIVPYMFDYWAYPVVSTKELHVRTWVAEKRRQSKQQEKEVTV